MATAGWWARAVAVAIRVELSRGLQAQVIGGALIGPLSAAIYILMARYLDRADATAYVVLAPIALGMWGTAMLASGEAVSSERYEGTLELLIAAPTPAALVVVGKVLAATIQSLIAIPLTLVAAALLGLPLSIAHPALFAVAIVALTLSTAAIGLVFASAFMLARSTRIFQNSIGFPLWIVSGVAFPISVLPEAIRPLSAFSALAWCVAALRAATGEPGGAWWIAIGATVILSAVYAVLGARLFVGVERRVRIDGSLSTF